jgi:hypothetical protein
MKIILFRTQIAVLVAASFILMSFKDKGPIKGWKLYETKKGTFKVSLENVDGKTAACISSNKAKTGAYAYLYMPAFKANKYLGKRIRLSANVKTESVKGWDALRMSVTSDSSNFFVYNFDNMKNRLIKGNTDWKKYELVLDVPKGSLYINIVFVMDSTGKSWISDLKLEEVDTTVAVTGKFWTQKKWGTTDKGKKDYAIGIDSSVKWNGAPTTYCKAVTGDTRKWDFMGIYLTPEAYLGKKVKITVYIKTSDIKKGLYYGVTVGYYNQASRYKYSHYISKKLGQDQDWTKYETIVYIPDNSQQVNYFVDVANQGEVWISNSTIEVVDDKTPTSDKNEKKYPAQPLFADGPTLEFVANK